MSIAISEQQVLYDNPCAPIVKFSYSNYLDEFDDEDVNDDPTSSNTTHDTLNSIENSFKASSLEDLVKSFDNTINTCFSDEELPTSIESIPTIENDLVVTSKLVFFFLLFLNIFSHLISTWSTLIENLRTSLCNDLKLPQISKNCQITMNNVQEKKFDDDDFISIDDLNEEEEEELREQLDMHLVSISKANHHSEEFLTAEQVITDIDFMLDDLTPDSGYGDDLHLSHINDKKFYLKNQSIKSLNFLYEELNESIKNLSGVLVEELAIRDELDYEQEMKNTFISLVLNIEVKIDTFDLIVLEYAGFFFILFT